MIINLKQDEIDAALRLYIVSQGINLAGKTVTIAFTAGRAGRGLSAELDIEDAAIPGYTDGTVLASVPTPTQPQQAKPVLTYPVGVRAQEALGTAMLFSGPLNNSGAGTISPYDPVPEQEPPNEAPPIVTKPISLFGPG